MNLMMLVHGALVLAIIYRSNFIDYLYLMRLSVFLRTISAPTR
jgi:hypothetical protein